MTYFKKETLKHFAILAIITLPIFLSGLFNHSLWTPDEPRVVEIGREMAITGNWAVPMLNRKPFLESPPLYYGILALTFRAFGEASDGIARIPSAFFAFATMIVLFFTVNHIFGPRAALLSGFILATTGEYFRVAHWIIVDNALTFFVVSAMALFITGYLSQNNRKKTFCYLLAYVASTLAFYSKGFIGIAIPGLGILLFLVMERNFKEILQMRLWAGILIFLVMTAPWFIGLWQQAGTEYFKIFFLHNHLQRFLPAGMAVNISGAASGHHNPFYYYITEFPAGFLPWSILLIPVLFHSFSKSGKFNNSSILCNRGRLFAKCWFIAGIIFLSLASTKRTLYLMPIFAPISLLTALYIDFTLTSGFLNKTGRAFHLLFGIFLFATGLCMTPVYLYLKNFYSQILPVSFLISVPVISFFVAALSLTGIYYLHRMDLRKYWVSVNLSIIILLVFAMQVIAPIVDKHKSFVPFCDHIINFVPPENHLYAYQPDETLRGAVPFYIGRFLMEIEEISEELLSKEEKIYLIIRDKRESLEKKLLSYNKFHILVKQMIGSDRALVLFVNRPVEKTIIIGDDLNRQHVPEKHKYVF